MKRYSLVEIICAILTGLWVYAAITKLLTYEQFYQQLQHSVFGTSFTPLVSVGVPLTEMVTSIFLLFPSAQWLGLYISLMLLNLFTGYIIFLLLFEANVPCSCGGLLNNLSWPEHLIFNIAFIGINLVGLYCIKHKTSYKQASLKTCRKE